MIQLINRIPSYIYALNSGFLSLKFFFRFQVAKMNTDTIFLLN